MTPADLTFLRNLRLNNNREWFNEHKEEYLKARAHFLDLIAAFIFGMGDIDESVAAVEPESCVFRIYRDVRYSKNKDPYKLHLGAFISGKGRKDFNTPGYYLHLEPGGESVYGAGLYMCDKDILAKLRRDLVSPRSRVAALFADKALRQKFPQVLEDDKTVRVPRGYDAAERNAELLKLRHFSVFASLTDKEVVKPTILNTMLEGAPLLKRFNSVLSGVISH